MIFQFLFAISIFLLRIPPFGNSIYQTNNLGRIILLALFFTNITTRYKKYYNITYIFILAYIIGITLSMLFAISMVDFLGQYKDLIISILIFHIYSSSYKSKGNNIIIFFLILSIVFNQLINWIYFLKIYPLFTLIIQSLYQKYYLLIETNAMRGKFFIDNTDFSMLPILFVGFTKSHSSKWRFTNLVMISSILLQSIFSNFRSLFLLCSLAMFIIILINKPLNPYFLLPIIICISVGFWILSTPPSSTSNSLTRLVIPGKEDIQSIHSRTSLLKNSINIFISSPIFGIGYGNLIYYANSNIFDKTDAQYFFTNQHAHNVFFELLAESGILGFLPFLFLTLFFIYKDYVFRNTATSYKVSFWILFLSSLINPSSTIQFQSTFWILRGLLEKEYQIVREEAGPTL